MELFDILLMSVVMITGYLGPMVLRRLGPGQRLYGWMVLGDLAAAVIAFASRYSEGPNPIGDALGAVAIGAGFCLVFLPPMLRDLGRRALIGDRLRLARLLADLRELLQPGMGARPERELIDTILAVREGREDEAIGELRRRRAETDLPLWRRHFDERIVMTYLYARRWDDAIRHFESHFEARFGGSSPQLMVEMIRAYCEAGELEAAAELVDALEGSPLAREPMLAVLLNRARVVFLAFVGRTGAVEAIVAADGTLGAMPASARSFWAGVARRNAGDRKGARASLESAVELAARDTRAREVAERELARLDDPELSGPHAIPQRAAELADRLTALATATPARSPGEERRRAVPKLRAVPLARVPVTVGLIAANLVASLAVYLAYGSLGDVGALAEAGANLKDATLAGEWWRLASSTFLHVGLAHLALNMYGLWVLGRLVEQLFGPVRFFAIYALAGVAGSLASLVGGGSTSAGASGAVLGLLGASVAELALHRHAWPRQWSRSLLGVLLFLTAANVGIGFLYPIIDQSAHIGGLVAGAALAALLSRQWRRSTGAALRGVAWLLATFGAAAFLYAAMGVATTDYRDTLGRFEVALREIGGLEVRAPSVWRPAGKDELADDGVGLRLQLMRVPATVGLDRAIDERLAAELSGDDDEAHTRRAARAELPIADPWRSSELEISVQGPGGEQRHRLVVFGRVAGDEIWLGAIFYPDAIGDGVAMALSELLASARPLPPS